MPNENLKFADREVLIVALGGWSNAANASTLAIKYLLDRLDVSFITEFECEDHMDLQMCRPLLIRNEQGIPTMHFPNLSLLTTMPEHTLLGGGVPLSEASGYVQHLLAMNPDDSEAAANEKITTVGGAPITNLHFLVGMEPNSGWLQLSSDIAETVSELGITDVIMLGAMMTDQPHTRPSTVHFTSESPALQKELEIAASEYEGPIGFGKALELFLHEIYEINTCAMWVSVPHYTHNLDSPRGAGALLDKLEETLDIVIPRATLQKDIAMWDENVEMMINRDSNLANFLRELESAYDARSTAENAGDEIVREFEQFLKGQDFAGQDVPGLADITGLGTAELTDFTQHNPAENSTEKSLAENDTASPETANTENETAAGENDNPPNGENPAT